MTLDFGVYYLAIEDDKNLCLNYAFGANPSPFSWKLAFKPSVTLGLCGMALLVLIHAFGQESGAVVKSVG